MNVFVDFHHSDLYYSLQLLIEKRLGWNLFRPIGEDWFKKGYWKLAKPYNDNEATIKQFLQFGSVAPDETPNLNEDAKKDNSHYIVKSASPIPHKALTLEQFKNKRIDFVIASYPPHIKAYARLIERYQPKAKLIHQMGNNWIGDIDFSLVKNLMSSTVPLEVPKDVNAVWYHQEFDLDIFKYTPPVERNNIYSFLNCFDETNDSSLFYKLEAVSGKNMNWKSFGSQCRDGMLYPHEKLAEKIKEATFVWQLKHTGDGFGHVIHNAYAIGRPCLINGKYYRNQLAEKLLEHKVTCLDLTKLGSKRKIIETIKEYSKPEVHDMMCRASYNRFKELVNYDQEEKEIKKFFQNLK